MMKLHTPDLTAQNIEKLAALFPNCVTESHDEKTGKLKRAIDFDQLRQELSDHVVDGPRERYHLDWPGKREALLAANAPIAKTLRPCREESVDFDTTKNLFIEGDNLDALKLLQETYLGKVKLIYIDPPYNTGNDFIYDDDFAEDSDGFLRKSNQKDEAGNRLIANTESNGRFHSDWLTMIYSRLKLALNLLRDDGFIVVSIDDAEIENMKALLNEVFGKQNEIAVLVWDRNRKNDAKFFSVGHEYMCIYAKSLGWHLEKKTILREPKEGLDEAKSLFEKLSAKHKNNWERVQEDWRDFYNAIPPSDERKKLGRFSKIGPRGPYRDDGNINWPGGGGPRYEVLHPDTGKPCKLPTSGWRYPTKKRFDEEVAAGKIVFGPDETTVPRIVSFLFDGEGQVMQSVFYSYAQTASVEFEALMEGKVFDNPKSWRDMSRLQRYLTGKDDIIVDFFAGSASSAHGVMHLNSMDGGNRRYILVQLPEECSADSVAREQGFTTISDVSKERIRRAGAKIKAENATTAPNLDVGFRVLKIDTSNMKDVYYAPDAVKQDQLELLTDNLKEDRTPEDLLFQVLVDWGVDLSLPIEKVSFSIGKERKDEGERMKDELGIMKGEAQAGGKAASGVHHSSFNLHPFEVFFVDGNALAACFDAGITEDLIKEIARRKPLRAVFRDSSYGSDSVKINVEQIFKLLSPGTELKSL